jgi:excinuclease ABC subunit C
MPPIIPKQTIYIVRNHQGQTIFVGHLRQIRRRFRDHLSHSPLLFLPSAVRKLGFTLTPALRPVGQTFSPLYNNTMANLKEKLKEVPHQPGVYKFLDKDGRVIYVGKAKDLRSRVMQYFGTGDNRVQLPFLMSEAVDLDYVVVNSELESLFLENTLIKEYMPPYNIKLRDDKNYAFIKIDYSTPIPQITYARKIENDRKMAKYFGPYSSTKKIKQTLDFVRRIFPYCSNKETGNRPCFYYFLHRCPGVCVGAISAEEYQRQLDRIILFLSGKTNEIKPQLRQDMERAAAEQKFELAARLRDSLQAMDILEEKQVTMFPTKVNWDFISIYIEGMSGCVNLFKVREGKLIDKENFIYENILHIPEDRRSTAILQSFTEMYYAQATDLPREIYTQEQLSDVSLINKLLQSRSKYKINVCVPTRGQKLKLIKLGVMNAEEYLKKWQRTQATNIDAINEILEELKQLLQLPAIPRRIEGYDISNIQGTNPVGSMVVVKDGIPAKSEYRKFKINTKTTPDDFAMMQEMLSRRLSEKHVAAQLPLTTDGNARPEKDKWPQPDLIVIDGGKGQLNVAVKILKERKLSIPVIGLAKRIEEVFLPGQSEPIILSHDNPVLQLLQRLRDEAHRFGITFHRSLRSKAAVKSALDQIPGIGPKTKKLLKQKIGTVAQIKQAPLEELAKLVGRQRAEQLKKHL